MSDPRAPWRTQIAELWLTVGRQVRDEFGEWWIVALPEGDTPFGYAQVEITNETSTYQASRHIYLCEFLRDFQPVEGAP